MAIRILLFCILAILGATGPLPLFALCFLLYTLVYTGFEVIFIAVCIDAYFGYGSGYYYTLSAGVLVLLVQMLRPKLFVYANE